jgi:two-component system NtrC family response regulator
VIILTDLLVVDDEEEILSMLKRNLELEGYDVTGANNREEALEEMKENLYPIVLLDIKFPDTSGPELLDRFKDINPLVNVIMITGYSSMENVVDCLGGGAVDYFTKPLEIDMITRRLEEISRKINRWKDSIGMG